MPCGGSGQTAGISKVWRHLGLTLLLAGLLGAPHGLAAKANLLADSPSPYLALHADDPVHWRPWGEAALAHARREGKLIFVSIGYFACHWCHVMQRESFQDPKIAERLNADFVAVKVDRELEPVLDAQLMEFLHATRGYGGWPLNVFLTPEGYPITGTVYLPPDRFLVFVERLQQSWTDDRVNLGVTAERAAMQLAADRQRQQRPADDPGAEALAKRFLQAVAEQADELSGGFGDQNKFPSVPQLRALLELAQLRDDAEQLDFVELTLERMAEQGLHDRLGGGFFRYTVDPDWQVPHFEKMLYDNALLARLYLSAGDRLGRPDFTRVGLETLAFMRREMRGREGAMIASLSALDDRDVEGGYYLWSRQELKDLLTPEQWAVAELAWGLDRPPILEHGYLPIRARSTAQVAERLGRTPEAVEATLERADAKALEQRASRGLPVDHKRLAGWNGLALGAFAEGARRGDRASEDAARDLRDFIAQRLWVDDTLSKAVDAQDRGLGPGSLEDYAYVADGMSLWAAHTGANADLALARDIAIAAWQGFHDERGWRLQRDSLLPLKTRWLTVPDGPLPSPSATLIEASLRIARLSDDPELAEQAERAGRTLSESMLQEAYANASHIALRLRGSQTDSPALSSLGVNEKGPGPSTGARSGSP